MFSLHTLILFCEKMQENTKNILNNRQATPTTTNDFITLMVYMILHLPTLSNYTCGKLRRYTLYTTEWSTLKSLATDRKERPLLILSNIFLFLSLFSFLGWCPFENRPSLSLIHLLYHKSHFPECGFCVFVLVDHWACRNNPFVCPTPGCAYSPSIIA